MSWGQGEFTGSGTVDINDLTIVLAHYNQSLGSSAAADGRRARTRHPGADRRRLPWPARLVEMLEATGISHPAQTVRFRFPPLAPSGAPA